MHPFSAAASQTPHRPARVRAQRLCAALLVLLSLLGGGTAHAQHGNNAGAGGDGGAPADPPAPPTPPSESSDAIEIETSFELEPSDAVRGARITIRGDRLPTDAISSRIWLDDVDIGPPTVVDKGKALSFLVPDAGKINKKDQPIAAKRYVLRLAEPTEDKQQPFKFTTLGVLRIVGEKSPSLTLDTVHPTIIYPDTKKIMLTGSGFGGRLRDYALLIDGVELALCAEGTVACSDSLVESHDDCCHGVVARFTSDHQLEIDGSEIKNGKTSWVFRDPRGGYLEGEHELGVRSGDVTASNQVDAAFSAWTAGQVKGIAVVFSALLLLGMAVLAMAGGGKHKVGSRVFSWGAFLLDTETDTYSLAKLQAFAWTATALVGYSYLALSRTLVQGKLDIVDVPTNLTSILGISLGTAVASIGITKVRGPKAAGALHPSFGDLINSGGVVSPERAFFLVWTVVSIATFLLNVYKVDPMVLSDLPAVPDGLLALSGLSAGGYLGGKIVRGPGPVVDEALLVVENGKFQIKVLGRCLGVDATFEVAGKPITTLLDPQEHRDGRAKVLTPEDNDSERFAKGLLLQVLGFPTTWKNAPAAGDTVGTLTIANSDGQRATAQVTVA